MKKKAVTKVLKKASLQKDMTIRDVYDAVLVLNKKFDTKIDALDKKLDTKINALDKKLDTKIDTLDKKFDDKFEKVYDLIEKFATATHERFETLETDMKHVKTDVSIIKDNHGRRFDNTEDKMRVVQSFLEKNFQVKF